MPGNRIKTCIKKLWILIVIKVIIYFIKKNNKIFKFQQITILTKISFQKLSELLLIVL